MDPTTGSATLLTTTLSTNQWMIILGIILILLQFIYKHFEHKANKEVMAASAKDNARVVSAVHNVHQAINEGIASFSPHIERTRSTHGMIKELLSMHKVRDDDGRPMWYMPRDMIETQKEIVKITSILAETQRMQVDILKEMRNKAEKHQESCQKQFNILDKKGS